MKKLLFLSFLILCSLSTIQAQFSLGVDGGVNINHLKFTESHLDETDAHTSYYFGFRPTYAISSKIDIGLGLQYSLKGYSFTNTANEGNIRNAYLDILPQVEIRPIKMLGIVGGLNIGYLNHTAAKIDGKWEKNPFLVDIFEDVDLGLLLGLKLYIKQIYLTAHYNHGIKNINDLVYTDANGEPLDVSTYNRNLQIGIGYMLNL